MSTLYVSEFADLPFASNGVIQAPGAAEWQTDQTVSIGGSSTPSNAFGAHTHYVVLSSDSVCSIAWTMSGAASVNDATTSNLRLPANAPLMFGAVAGMKLSVIANT